MAYGSKLALALMPSLPKIEVDIDTPTLFIRKESARKLYPVLKFNWSINLTFFVPAPVVSAKSRTFASKLFPIDRLMVAERPFPGGELIWPA